MALRLKPPSLPHSFLPEPAEWREQVADDAPSPGFDFSRDRHAGFQRGQPILGLDARCGQRYVRQVGRLPGLALVLVVGVRVVVFSAPRLNFSSSRRRNSGDTSSDSVM